ncbi:MAG: hypothetical protein NXI16_14145 [Alphaproteobacteria bacterium]|nr:hypothetical protein [Alphaproteobacteria bacterium]
MSPAVPELTADGLAFLDLCRKAAVRTRGQRRVDPESLERTASLIRNNMEPRPAPETMVEWVVHFMRFAMPRPPRFYPSGAQELSFDESWLVALHGAFRRNDPVSIAFLLNSQLQTGHARCLWGYLTIFHRDIHSDA